jgi:hypothetical protein
MLTAGDSIKTFTDLLPDFLILRHEQSRWNGEPLIQLKPLHWKLLPKTYDY